MKSSTKANPKIVKRKKKYNKSSILLKVAVFIFIVYIAFVLVEQQVMLKQKEQQLKDIQHKITLQQLKNEEMIKFLQATDEENEKYMIKKARESLDYAFQDEQVFVGISGN